MKELFNSFIKAQSEIKGAIKDSTNPHFRSSYANIESVIESLKEPLKKHSLAFLQPVYSENDRWYLKTLIIHESGQQLDCGQCEIIIQDKTNPQKFKASLTYFRRSCLLSVFGIADVDDDGNEASQTTEHKRAPVVTQPVVAVTKPKNYAPQTSYDAFKFADNSQYAGRTFKEVPMNELKAYVEKISNSYKDKPLDEKATQFFALYNDYIRSLNGKN